jgi:hypothetical protein
MALAGFAALQLPVVAIAATDVEASPAMVKVARQFGDTTLDLKVGDADKAVFLVGPDSDLRLAKIEVLPPADDATSDNPGTMAIIRTRSRPVDRPTLNDRAFAERRAISVFIIGEWVRPAPMWEIGRHNGAMMFRAVDKDGVAREWQSWP